MKKALERKKQENQTLYYFKPTQTGPMNILEFVLSTEEIIFADEIEALKLHNIDNLSQIDVAKKMGISQPTVTRILKKAYKKITKALIEGKTIKIQNAPKK